MNWERYQQQLSAVVVRVAEELVVRYPNLRYTMDEMTWDDAPLSCSVELFRTGESGLVEVGLEVAIRSPLDEKTALASASKVSLTYKIRHLSTSDLEEEIRETTSFVTASVHEAIVDRVDEFLQGFDEFVRRRQSTLQTWTGTL